MSKIIWTDAQVSDIISLYSSKNTIDRISEIYGVSPTAINNLLRRNKINISNHLDKSASIKNNKKDIIKLYKNNISSVEIGKKYDVDYGIIIKYLRNWGIKIKSGTSDYKKYKCDEKIFQKIDSHEKAYWLGFLVGDGCILDKKNTLKLDLAKVDQDHLLKFKNFMKATNPIYYWEQKVEDNKIYKHACIGVCSSMIVSDLYNLKCGPRKSLKEEFPPIDNQYYNSFILGLVDADGSWFINHANKKPMLSFFLGSSLHIIKYIKSIFDRNLGISDNKIIEVTYKIGIMGRIMHSSKDDTLKIFEYLYRDSPVFLERKRKIIEDHFYENF